MRYLAMAALAFLSITSYAQKKNTNPKPYATTITDADLKRHLYIVAGADMEGRETATAGERKAIAFILPNALGDSPVMEYACTIDKVEKVTGIDFFPKMLKGLDEELEASLDVDAWPINKARQEERIKVWNKQR